MQMFIDGIVGVGIYEIVTRKPIDRELESDSQAMLQAYATGLSTQLAHARRTHGISLAWCHEQWAEHTRTKVPGIDLEADLLTKSLAAERVQYLRELCGLRVCSWS
jgi:hypothetical protein